MSTPPTHQRPPRRRHPRGLSIRESRRAPLPFILAGILVAILGYWITHHWHLSGAAATGLWFAMLFLWVGILSFWFGRKRE